MALTWRTAIYSCSSIGVAIVLNLKRVEAERQATLEAFQESLEKLKEQNVLLRKALFSPRRERFTPSPDQLLLFTGEDLAGNDLTGGEAASDEKSDEVPSEDVDPEPPQPKPRRTKRKRFEFPECLPVKRVEHPLTSEESTAMHGGSNWQVVKELATRHLEFNPASAYILEEVRYVYAAGENSDGPLMATSEKPPSINEKGVFGASAIAYLAQSKFERHLPLYRLQEELQTASTMWFSRSVLCGALLRAADGLQPLRDLLLLKILKSFYLRADETTSRVLRPGTGKTDQPYLWVYCGDEDYFYQVFDYQLDRSRDGPAAILADYLGGLLTDGYVVYSSLVAQSNGRLLDLGCWAHARRKFDEACAVTTHPLAMEALAWIWKLYDIDDSMVDAGPVALLAARQRESVPILNRFYKRLVEVQPTVRPSSKLAEAIGYLLNRWDAMTRYTTDARYAMDNNATERSVRPTVLGRKNYLFFGNDDGGRAACTWYTIIQSARINHVRVLPYLNDVLVRIPAIVPEYLRIGDAKTPFEALTGQQLDALTELLPDRWLKNHPEHRCEDRQRELEEANRRRRARRALRRRPVSA